MRSGAFAVVALGLVGLPLALLGELRRLPTAVGAVLVFALLHLLWHRGRGAQEPRPPAGRAGTVVALLALAVAVTSGAVNASQHHSHLLVDGDPAVYAVTGTLLARTGGLTVPTEADTAFAGNDSLDFSGAGYYDQETGDQEAGAGDAVTPQFFHLLPVLLAVASWVGGTPLLLLVNPVLGAFSLLALYALAARLVRPVWALLATSTLAVLLPQLHFSRDTYSEIPSQLLVLTGLALLWDVTGPRRAGRTASTAQAVIAGLVLGGSAMARIDAFLYLVPLAVALVLLRTGRTGLAVLAGAGISSAVALADGYLGSPIYVAHVQGQLLQAAAALVLVGLAAVVLRLLTSANPQHQDAGDLRKSGSGSGRADVPAWIPRLGARLAWPVAGLTVALAAFAWFVRPLVQVTRKIPDRTNATIARLQESEGLAVDVPRSYDELTMVWLSWYLGPVGLALGVLGLAYLVWRLLRGQDLRLAPLVLLVGLVTAVYLYHPGIFPVHYWASRRFLPVTFPGLVLLAVLVCERLWTRGRQADGPRERRLLPALGAAGAAGVLLLPLALLPGATLPRAYDGMVGAVEQMCGALLPSDVVLLVGKPAADGLLQPVQGHCGVTAASAGPLTDLDDVREVERAAHAAGRRLVLLSSTPDPALAPPGVPFRPVFDVTVPTQALALTRRPDEVFPYRLRLFAAYLPPA